MSKTFFFWFSFQHISTVITNHHFQWRYFSIYSTIFFCIIIIIQTMFYNKILKWITYNWILQNNTLKWNSVIKSMYLYTYIMLMKKSNFCWFFRRINGKLFSLKMAISYNSQNKLEWKWRKLFNSRKKKLLRNTCPNFITGVNVLNSVSEFVIIITCRKNKVTILNWLKNVKEIGSRNVTHI